MNFIRTDIEKRGEAHIARVTIDHARRLNTMNRALMGELVAALEALAKDETLRAVVITGAGGKAFIGGADIDEMSGMEPASAEAFITMVHKSCDAVRAVPMPTIARIDGYTFGAGLELAASCDLRVASERSVFGMPEVKLGIPSVVEAALLPGLVGWGRTREMLLLGENFTAHEAAEWGFVERVVPASELDDAVERWIVALLSCGPDAVRRQKALIRRWEELPLKEAIRAGIGAFAASWQGDEPRRMMAEFQAARAARKRQNG